jgi:hypothetical protein
MSENQINLPFPDQENTGPTLEEQAAAIDAEETTEAQAQDDTPERPDWLPQKFKTPEDMARSYAELEKKLGSNKQQQEEAVEQATQESATNMDGLISSAETEFLENGGELSDSTYEQFEKMGVPRAVVDQVRDMRVAQAEQTRQQIINEFGGQESVDAMSTFAARNYDDGMIERLNGMLASNDLATVRMAMNQIRSDFQAQAPAQDPTRRVSGRSLPAIEGFRSQAEIIEAINDPRYRNDNAYREDVERRIGMSNL